MRLHKIIRKTISSLSDETYSKESYFKERNGLIVCCPHGAAQIIANPKVARALKSEDELDIILAVCNDHATSSAAVAHTAFIQSTSEVSKLTVFHNRPEHVKHFFFNYGEQSIHWLLGMFGITSHWNSHPETTLAMVRERLELAFEFAKTHNL